MSNSVIPETISSREMLNALLSGVPPKKLRLALSKLSPVRLQKLLCTACSMYRENKPAYAKRGKNIERLLRAHCRMYTTNADCQISRFFQLEEADDVETA